MFAAFPHRWASYRVVPDIDQARKKSNPSLPPRRFNNINTLPVAPKFSRGRDFVSGCENGIVKAPN
jgi:hypothetical protein